MAKHAVLRTFYASSKWMNLRLQLIAERGNRCEICEQLISSSFQIHGHHKVEITPENVHDYSISLNPENIALICKGCHDKEHGRFSGAVGRRVFVVYGAPLSGKSTYVRSAMARGDLVVDMNTLYAAMSMLPEYDKPDNLLTNVFGTYNALLDQVKTRLGRWQTAWVITGGQDKHRREQLANDLGAELIFCEATKEECLARLEADIERRYRRGEWRGFINDWFDKYSE